MKYLFSKVDTLLGIQEVILIEVVSDVYKHIPIKENNHEYGAFLEQAKLTDKQVKALTPDTWYDFPEGE